MTGSAPPRRGRLRTDIQGLRAIAVSLVLVYHLWPEQVRGGFVGVDVFFVISGFLITSHLLARPPTDGRGLAEFWSRRIRRLLPASLLVLAATLVASRAVAPETQWENTARQAGAAALYVVNWVLARDSVDYLAAESAPSPVQHYWSLSVEEQFYFVWPILVLLLVWLSRRTRLRTSYVVGTGLGLVVLASLAWSVHATATDPAAAYFVTPTRIWELGIGGLLAAAVAAPWSSQSRREAVWVRSALAWAGIAAMLLAGWAYSAETPFPGYQALLPVLGAAAVIAADSTSGGLSPGPVLALRPVQWLGDVSYSVYLWHWPLIVLLPAALGRALGPLDRLSIVGATLLLAALTKTYVEDRYRRPGPRVRPVYLAGVAGMAVVVGIAGLQLVEVSQRAHQAERELAAAIAGDDPCFGAAALSRESCPRTTAAPVVPAPAEAARDRSDAYEDVGGDDCWAYLPDFATRTCVFGDAGATTTVALVGNSHAGQWLPALQALAQREHWRITTYLGSRCAMSAVRQEFATSAQADACEGWVSRTTGQVVDDRPDLVVLSNRISVDGGSSTGYREGYRKVIDTWTGAGIPVLALHDTPAPGDGGVPSVPDCLAGHPEDFAPCSGDRADWSPDDPVVAAVGGRLARSADLTDHICGPRTCDGAVGGVVVYFDASHLTATYNRTLAPYLRPYVLDALAAG